MHGINKNHFSLFTDRSGKSSPASEREHRLSEREQAHDEDSFGLPVQRNRDAFIRRQISGQDDPFNAGPLQALKDEFNQGFRNLSQSSHNTWRMGLGHSSSNAHSSSGLNNSFAAQCKQSLNTMGILPSSDNPERMPWDIPQIADPLPHPGDGNICSGLKRPHPEPGLELNDALRSGTAGKRRKTGDVENAWRLASVTFGDYEYDIGKRILKNSHMKRVRLHGREQALLHAFACHPYQKLSFTKLAGLTERTLTHRELSTRLYNLREALGLGKQQSFVSRRPGPHHADPHASYYFLPDDTKEVSRDKSTSIRLPDPKWCVEYKGFRFHLDRNHAVETATGRKIILTPEETALFRQLYNDAAEKSRQAIHSCVEIGTLYSSLIAVDDGASKTAKANAVKKLISAFNKKFIGENLPDALIQARQERKAGAGKSATLGYSLQMDNLPNEIKRLPSGEPPPYASSARIRPKTAGRTAPASAVRTGAQ